MKRFGFCAVALILSACQSGPPVETIEVTASATPVAPVMVLVEATADPNAPRVNQWGGEVPEAAPTGPPREGTMPPLKDS